MKNKSPGFMGLLEKFFSEYMPHSAGLSENTLLSYKYAFRLLFDYLYREKIITADKVTFRHSDFDTVNGFLLWLEENRKCSPATRNLRLAALSSFAAYAQNRNLEAATTFRNSVKKVPVKKHAEKIRTVFSLDEVAALLRMPDTKTKIGFRDYAILNLMYASGARAQEICDLTVRNLQFQGDITKLTLIGKGEKMRRINVAKPCASVLKQYIEKRWLQNDLNRHIFSSQTHEHMKPSCIRMIFKKYVKLAKKEHPSLFLESYSPHSMRHSTATHMLEAGIPLMAIKNFLGHVSVATTERYAALSQNTVNKYIREWNQKWFPHTDESDSVEKPSNRLPDFLR